MAHSNNLNWIYELDETEVKKLLDRDLRLVYDYCELSTLVDLLENLPSMSIFISKRSIDRCQAKYIAEKFKGGNHKELAAKLGCSERYVYKVLKRLHEERLAPKEEPSLFEKHGA